MRFLDPNVIVADYMRSAATLIIAPAAITLQWAVEIARHAPALTIAIYHGVSSANPGSTKAREKSASILSTIKAAHFYEMPTREVLGAFDIVLIAYEWMKSEIHYLSAFGQGRSRRTEARFPVRQSPLIQIDWWRIVADEAQMIEV